jgi:SulP family sulfate permease
MKIAFHPKLLDCLPTTTGLSSARTSPRASPWAYWHCPWPWLSPSPPAALAAAGIWTAIVAGLITSLFGGSRVQIGGPTGAFIPIIYGIVAIHGLPT